MSFSCCSGCGKNIAGAQAFEVRPIKVEKDGDTYALNRSRLKSYLCYDCIEGIR